MYNFGKSHRTAWSSECGMNLMPVGYQFVLWLFLKTSGYDCSQIMSIQCIGADGTFVYICGQFEPSSRENTKIQFWWALFQQFRHWQGEHARQQRSGLDNRPESVIWRFLPLESCDEI